MVPSVNARDIQDTVLRAVRAWARVHDRKTRDHLGGEYVNTAWLKRWLFTTNHKEVGILYLVTSFFFAFLAGILAFLMRTQLALPSEKFLAPPQYNEAVTMHGLLMVLWFLSPLGIAFANYFVPLQIGAKDVAFARLNATSYWLYVFAGFAAFVSFFVLEAHRPEDGQPTPLSPQLSISLE